MDSKNLSEEKRQASAKRFTERHARLVEDPIYRANTRRNNVGVDLAIAVAESQLTRQAVADKAGMKPSLLSRQLSGDVNLTLDAIGKICEAIGYDFDMVLRKTKEKAALQPWQQRMDRTDIVQLVNEHRYTSNQYSSREVTVARSGPRMTLVAANGSAKFSAHGKFDYAKDRVEERLAA